MDVILATEEEQDALVYIVSIIIFSPTSEDHIQHVEYFLRLINQAELTDKLQKCHFLSNAINYIGHLITPGSLPVALNTEKTIHI